MKPDIHLPIPGRLEDQSWRAHAACRGLGPDLFFPETGVTAHAARRLCASCPVSEQCLAECYAMGGYYERWGMWGGTTPNDRRKKRRRPMNIDLDQPTDSGEAA